VDGGVKIPKMGGLKFQKKAGTNLAWTTAHWPAGRPKSPQMPLNPVLEEGRTVLSEDREENAPEEHGFSYRQVSSIFRLPLTSSVHAPLGGAKHKRPNCEVTYRSRMMRI
jgi:hypothetical protein